MFFTAIPFGMNAQEMNGWLHYGGGLELWREAYAPFNIIPFAGGSSGVQMAGWFNREVNSVADLQGLKMRIPGLAGEVFAEAGGTAVRIAGGELYPHLPPSHSKLGPITATASDGKFESKKENVTSVIDTTTLPAGKHIFFVRGKDADGNWGTLTAGYLER